jgi:translation initiation factor IF-3
MAKSRSRRLRLVDERGEMVGIVTRNEALDMAADAGLDLVEIAPNADPPVCKILDFGKYKYEEQKKKNEAKEEAEGHRGQGSQIPPEHR